MINPDMHDMVQLALRKLAAVCDFAMQDDAVGFSASHACRGHELAAKDKLTDPEIIEGADICSHYSRQLGEELHGAIKGMLFIELSEGLVLTDLATNESKNVVYIEDLPPPPLAEPLGITLTEEQSQAVNMIDDWMKDPDLEEFRLGGYAGTGKTTVIRYILDQLRREYGIKVCAFTGKAVNVLQRKKIRAQTMHSLMYNVDVDKKTNAVTFRKKSFLDDEPDLIIVDEASMISSELYTHLRSFRKKLLFVGDPGQLEPVGDNPDLMRATDFVLSKIHRQAEKSPIVRLATKVREGGYMEMTEDPDGLYIRPKALKASEAVTMDQIICAKNATRNGMNDKLRIFLGRKGYLDPREKIMVLRNNPNWGVFNGMILYIDEILETKYDCWVVNAHDDLDQQYGKLPIWNAPFTDPTLRTKKDIMIPRDRYGMQLVFADYGYVITCHKSQGSEWDKVLVYDEWMPPKIWDMKRWRYTAITRAAKELTYLV